MERATIVSIRQQQIIYHNKKVGRPMGLVASISVFAMLVMCFSCLKVMDNKVMNEVFHIAQNVFSPIQPLYSDNSEINFASSTYTMYLKKNEDVKLTFPVRASGLEEKGDHILFRADSSIMVLSPEDGVVVKIDTTADGKKYIEVKHSDSLSSKLVGIDVTGVTVGQTVAQGQELATLDNTKELKFYLLQNGSVVQNLKIEHQNIVWEA